MKIKVSTWVEKKMVGTVGEHAEIPSWIASFEDCGICLDPITCEHKAVLADLDFDDGHGEKKFFHKACFDHALKGNRHVD